MAYTLNRIRVKECENAKHYNKSSLFPSFDLGSATSGMLFTKSLVGLVPGVTSARQKDCLVQGEKNISEILNNVLKAPM